MPLCNPPEADKSDGEAPVYPAAAAAFAVTSRIGEKIQAGQSGGCGLASRFFA